MTPHEKALNDLWASSRDNTTSNSIKFGRWVGYGACQDIVRTLAKEYEEEIQKLEHKMSVILDLATGSRLSKPNTDMEGIRQAIHDREVEIADNTEEECKELYWDT